jgi:Cu(I)/Ag(I) efflux system membrane protein CusA/SilA
VRYARAERQDEETVKRLLVNAGRMSAAAMTDPSESGDAAMAVGVEEARHRVSPGHAASGTAVQIPLSSIADVRIVEGPAKILSENGKLMNYVTLNVRGRDMVGFVEEAQRVVREKVTLPEGVHLEWSGQFEHQIRAANTLRFIFPVVVVLIFVILYLTYKDLADASLMMLAVPEALAGGAFFLFLWPKLRGWDWDIKPYDFSVAVWVGFIACFGMATETGIIMLVYLREAIEKRGGLVSREIPSRRGPRQQGQSSALAAAPKDVANMEITSTPTLVFALPSSNVMSYLLFGWERKAFLEYRPGRCR